MLDKLRKLWAAEPILVVYVVGAALWGAYEAWQGGLGVEQAIQAFYVAAAAAVARSQVWAPDTVEDLQSH